MQMTRAGQGVARGEAGELFLKVRWRGTLIQGQCDQPPSLTNVSDTTSSSESSARTEIYTNL